MRFCHINTTSAKKHREELFARYHDVDVISINETNLHDKQHFNLPGFNIFRYDRPDKGGGGVLLAVRSHLKCHEVLCKQREQNECVAVQLETKDGLLLVCSLYVPPKAKISRLLFEELEHINTDCLILGDLNAASVALGSNKTNTNGRQLEMLVSDGILSCIDDALTTYEKDDYEEKIDWILATHPTILLITHVQTHPPLGTLNGHKPMTFELIITPDRKPPSPRIQYSFKSANWPTFRKQLNQQLTGWDCSRSLLTPIDIDTYAKFITESIVTASQTAIPRCSGLIRLEISSITKQLIKSKHQLYRSWKRTQIEQTKHEYYRAKAKVALSLRNDRLIRIRRMTDALTTNKMNTGKVWAMVRKYHNKRTKQQHTAILKYHQQTAHSDNEKANMFADYFANDVYSGTDDSTAFHRHITNAVEKIKRLFNRLSAERRRAPPPPITAKELKCLLKSLPNTSPGPDNVHNRCLKNYTDSLIEHLLKLFNASMSIGYVPDVWKQAYIILLLKPGKDRHLPSSYRPISLLSCLGKLLEKIVKQRLMTELDRRNILPYHQAGFRTGRSTLYNILRLGHHAQEALDKHHHAAVIFFDVKAAFDSVWHDGLIYKLNDLKLPDYLIRWIVSFLTNRTACIELENQLSSSFSLRSGTPQGSPLSPLLYILYTADSMNTVPKHTEYGLFADDTALWTSSNTTTRVRERLQEAIDEFERWCISWKLVLQPTKTELIHFSPHPRKRYPQPIHLQVGTTTIYPQHSARYLGIIFDQKLDWRPHIRHVESNVQCRISLLKFLRRLTPEANDRTMLNLFKSLVRPLLTYGSSVLLQADNKIWQRLDVIHNKALRAALGVPHFTSTTYLRTLISIPPIQSYIEHLTQRALVRAQISEDEVTEANLTHLLHL